MPQERSLAFHLLLPLLDLPATSLGPPENIRGVFLSTTDNILVVEVEHAPLLSDKVYQHPCLHHNYLYHPSYWLQFTAPEEFLPEFQAFREGKYSQFSPRARTLFSRQYAHFFKNPGRDLASHLLYFSMGPQAYLVRQYWETELALGPKVLDNVELYYLPSEHDLITL